MLHSHLVLSEQHLVHSQAAENAKTLAMAQGQQADNLSWANRVQSLQDDVDLYTYINSRVHAQLKAKEDKVNTLLELVEQDPEIKKRLDEVMLNKNK